MPWTKTFNVIYRSMVEYIWKKLILCLNDEMPIFRGSKV